MRAKATFIILFLALAACTRQTPAISNPVPDPATAQTVVEATVAATAPAVEITATDTPPATPTPPATLTPALTPAPSATMEPATPTASPIADPYTGLTIADLASRSYGGGALSIVETIHVSESFTRTLVTYPSDGLTIHGFMNVPFGQGPFPVTLVLHGYIPPRQYNTIAYTTRYADVLARNGYLVVHPNYRNHPPSDQTTAFAAGLSDDDFRIGYAIDVLNLLALIQEQGGIPGPLAQADPQQLHLLGHSMGGGIALRVITVNPDVDAAVLYGAMSGDEAKNFERIMQWSNGQSGAREMATPPEDLQRISPIHHLTRIEAAVSIHHGDLDDTVPPEWSTELCRLLQQHGKAVECFNYPGAPHSFHDDVDWLFQQRVLDFFARY